MTLEELNDSLYNDTNDKAEDNWSVLSCQSSFTFSSNCEDDTNMDKKNEPLRLAKPFDVNILCDSIKKGEPSLECVEGMTLNSDDELNDSPDNDSNDKAEDNWSVVSCQSSFSFSSDCEDDTNMDKKNEPLRIAKPFDVNILRDSIKKGEPSLEYVEDKDVVLVVGHGIQSVLNVLRSFDQGAINDIKSYENKHNSITQFANQASMVEKLYSDLERDHICESLFNEVQTIRSSLKDGVIDFFSNELQSLCPESNPNCENQLKLIQLSCKEISNIGNDWKVIWASYDSKIENIGYNVKIFKRTWKT